MSESVKLTLSDVRAVVEERWSQADLQRRMAKRQYQQQAQIQRMGAFQEVLDIIDGKTTEENGDDE